MSYSTDMTRPAVDGVIRHETEELRDTIAVVLPQWAVVRHEHEELALGVGTARKAGFTAAGPSPGA